jgi:hypothetical protein
VDRLALPALDDDTVLVRRPGAVCVLRQVGDDLVVLLGDRTMRMPVRLHAAMTFVQSQLTLRPRDLDEFLDEQSRLVLSRRLVREGLLQVLD